MLKRWFKLAVNELFNKNEVVGANESNGISVNDRHFSSTCPNPGRVIKYTQNQDLLPQYSEKVSPSWDCFKENTIMGALNSEFLKRFTCLQGYFKRQCCLAEFSV